eukprot:scpid18494/ scgid26457/ 
MAKYQNKTYCGITLWNNGAGSDVQRYGNVCVHPNSFRSSPAGCLPFKGDFQCQLWWMLLLTLPSLPVDLQATHGGDGGSAKNPLLALASNLYPAPLQSG